MSNIRTNCDCVTHQIGVNLHPPLDTLAQLDIFPTSNTNAKALETLEKRAFAKYYTMKLLYPLIDLKNDREKMYWNTFHCVNTFCLHSGPYYCTMPCLNTLWSKIARRRRLRKEILIN
jgi:hypothetical protein